MRAELWRGRLSRCVARVDRHLLRHGRLVHHRRIRGLRAACTDNLAGLYKKQGGTEPSDEKIKKKEAKALAEEAVQGFAAPTKKMDLLECQTAVELLAEEMALGRAMVLSLIHI